MTLHTSRSVGEFALKRFARLYPAFAAAAVVLYVAGHFTDIAFFKLKFHDLLANLTLQTLLGSSAIIPGAWWSLAVEIKFYILTAFLWALLGRYFWIGLVVLALSDFAYPGSPLHAWNVAKYLPFYLAGVGLWLAIEDRQKLIGALVCATSIALTLVSDPSVSRTDLAFIWTMAAAMTLGIIFAPNFNIWKLALLGEMSYAMFLMHEPVGVLVMRFLASHMAINNEIKISIAIAFCYGIAAIIYFAVEKPGRGVILRAAEFSRLVPARRACNDTPANAAVPTR